MSLKNRLLERINSLNFSDSDDDDDRSDVVASVTKSTSQNQSSKQRMKQSHNPENQPTHSQLPYQSPHSQKYNVEEILQGSKEREQQQQYVTESTRRNLALNDQYGHNTPSSASASHAEKSLDRRHLSASTTTTAVKDGERSEEKGRSVAEIEDRIMRLEMDLSRSMRSNAGGGGSGKSSSKHANLQYQSRLGPINPHQDESQWSNSYCSEYNPSVLDMTADLNMTYNNNNNNNNHAHNSHNFNSENHLRQEKSSKQLLNDDRNLSELQSQQQLQVQHKQRHSRIVEEASGKGSNHNIQKNMNNHSAQKKSTWEQQQYQQQFEAKKEIPNGDIGFANEDRILARNSQSKESGQVSVRKTVEVIIPYRNEQAIRQQQQGSSHSQSMSTHILSEYDSLHLGRNLDVFEKKTKELSRRVARIREELDDESEASQCSEFGLENNNNNQANMHEMSCESSTSRSQRQLQQHHHPNKSILKNHGHTSMMTIGLNPYDPAAGNISVVQDVSEHQENQQQLSLDEQIRNSQLKLFHELNNINNNNNNNGRSSSNSSNNHNHHSHHNSSSSQSSWFPPSSRIVTDKPHPLDARIESGYRSQSFLKQSQQQQQYSSSQSSVIPQNHNNESSFVSASEKQGMINLLEREKHLLEEITNLRKENVELAKTKAHRTDSQQSKDNHSVGYAQSSKYFEDDSEVGTEKGNSSRQNGSSKGPSNKQQLHTPATRLPPKPMSKRETTEMELLKKETVMLKEVERIRKTIQHSIKKRINEDKVVEKEFKQQKARMTSNSKKVAVECSHGISSQTPVKRSNSKSRGGSSHSAQSSMVSHCQNCSFLLNRGIPTTYCSCDTNR